MSNNRYLYDLKANESVLLDKEEFKDAAGHASYIAGGGSEYLYYICADAPGFFDDFSRYISDDGILSQILESGEAEKLLGYFTIDMGGIKDKELLERAKEAGYPAEYPDGTVEGRTNPVKIPISDEYSAVLEKYFTSGERYVFLVEYSK